CLLFFFSSRRRHTRFSRDWSSDVCSSDLCPLAHQQLLRLLLLRPRRIRNQRLEIRRAGYSQSRLQTHWCRFRRAQSKHHQTRERSEERRVEKECKTQKSAEHVKKKREKTT